MTLDEALRATIVAIQPHLDRDRANPQGVDDMFDTAKRLFAEEPAMGAAFGAAVVAIAMEARRGHIRIPPFGADE